MGPVPSSRPPSAFGDGQAGGVGRGQRAGVGADVVDRAVDVVHRVAAVLAAADHQVAGIAQPAGADDCRPGGAVHVQGQRSTRRRRTHRSELVPLAGDRS